MGRNDNRIELLELTIKKHYNEPIKAEVRDIMLMDAMRIEKESFEFIESIRILTIIRELNEMEVY